MMVIIIPIIIKKKIIIIIIIIKKKKIIIKKKTHHNNHKSFANFYIRGKDNFSRRNIHDREIYTHRDNYGKSNYNDDSFDYDDDYDDFNNKSFVGLESFNNRRGYKKILIDMILMYIIEGLIIISMKGEDLILYLEVLEVEEEEVFKNYYRLFMIY